jgi:hypothetical protein
MNRRGFLGAIAGGLVLDPERLLWRRKRYVVGVDWASGPDVTVAAEFILGRVHEFWTRDKTGFWIRTTEFDHDNGREVISREVWPASEPPFARVRERRLDSPQIPTIWPEPADTADDAATRWHRRRPSLL